MPLTREFKETVQARIKQDEGVRNFVCGAYHEESLCPDVARPCCLMPR